MDKHIDDAYGVLECPIDQPDYADRAIAFSRDIHAELSDINTRLKAKSICHIISISGLELPRYGSCNMVSRLRFSYSCLCDAVNIAARLKSMTKITGIALSVAESTIKAARAGTDLIKVYIAVRESGHGHCL